MTTLALEDKGYTELSVCNCGRQSCKPSHKFGPNVRNYYLIHFVISGGGTLISPKGKSHLSAGDAFIIRPGEITVYEADAFHPWEYIWIGFRGNLSERFNELGDSFRYDSATVEELDEAFGMNLGKEELLTGILFKLYARIFGERLTENHANKAKSYINAHYMEDVSIEGIAEILNLNRKYLSRIFKAAHGVSMQSFLIDKRLHEGKKLLARGYTVEECAYMVGYNDPFGFSKAFKKKYSYPPKEARRRQAEK